MASKTSEVRGEALNSFSLSASEGTSLADTFTFDVYLQTVRQYTAVVKALGLWKFVMAH